MTTLTEEVLATFASGEPARQRHRVECEHGVSVSETYHARPAADDATIEQRALQNHRARYGCFD